MKAASRSSDPGPLLVPSPALRGFGRREEREWLVPVEMVVAMTKSVHGETIRKRMTRGDAPKPDARVFIRGGLFFAMVEYLDGRHSLLLPLPGLPWENGALPKVGGERE